MTVTLRRRSAGTKSLRGDILVSNSVLASQEVRLNSSGFAINAEPGKTKIRVSSGAQFVAGSTVICTV